MPSQSPHPLIRDLNAGVDVTSSLSQLLRTAPRAEQLQVVTSILDHVSAALCPFSVQLFDISISALRQMTPHLHKTSKSIAETRAAIERYAVNYALFLHSKAMIEHVPRIVVSTLQAILKAREEERKPDSDATRRKRKGGRPRRESNDCIADAQLDKFLFPGAAAIGLRNLLPRADASVVATTICAAMSVRLTTVEDLFDLDDILVIAKHLILPWIRYLQSLSKRTHRNCNAYLSRVNSFLFSICKPTRNPVSVLQVRAFALQLQETTLKRFAKDLLYSANAFTRDQNVRKLNIPIYEVVAQVYEDALSFVERTFSMTDQRWLAEDVSAWMDNALLVWANRAEFKSPPPVFKKRIEQLKSNTVTDEFLVQCYQLQLSLYNSKAYHSCKSDAKTAAAKMKAWSTVHKTLESLEFFNLQSLEQRSIAEASSAKLSSPEAIEEGSMRCLRLLRTLEVARRKAVSVSTNSKTLPVGIHHLFLAYARVIEHACFVLSHRHGSSDGFADIKKRIQTTVGGGIEALKLLLDCAWEAGNMDAVSQYLTLSLNILKAHAKESASSAYNWKKWLLSSLASVCKMKVSETTKGLDSSGEQLLSTLVINVKRCEAIIATEGDDDKICLSIRDMLLGVARDCYLLMKDWKNVVSASFSRISVRTELHRQCPDKSSVCAEGGHVLAGDVGKLVIKEKGTASIKLFPTNRELLLSALLRYSCWIRQNRVRFRSESNFEETLFALQQARHAIFDLKKVASENCPVRLVHQEWMRYLCFANCSGDFSQPFESVEESEFLCDGHGELSCRCDRIRGERCTLEASSIMRKLVQLSNSVSSEDISETKRTLEKLDIVISKLKPSSTELEVPLLCVEILQWVSIALSLQSQQEVARAARGLADVCLSLLEIQRNTEEPDITPSDLPISLEWATICDNDEGLESAVDNSAKLSDQLLAAEKNLKQCLRDFDRSSKVQYHRLSPCSTHKIAGTSIVIGYHPGTELGQALLYGIVRLVQCLYILARLRFLLEDVREAKYYIERCDEIAKQSFPPSNLVRNKISTLVTLYSAKSDDGFASVEHMITVAAKKRTSPVVRGAHPPNTHPSYVNVLVGSILFLKFAFPHVQLKRKTLDSVLELCKRVEKNTRISGANNPNLAMLTLFHKGMAHSLLGNYNGAIACFRDLRECNGCESMKPAALYMLARDVLSSTGTLEEWLRKSTTPKPKRGATRRTTRSRARKTRAISLAPSDAALDEARDYLTQGIERMPRVCCDVRLSRRIGNVAGILEANVENSVKLLSGSIGHAFNARLQHAMMVKERRLSRLTENSGEVGAHMAMLESTVELNAELVSRLVREKIVLIGINFDSTKGGFVIWRVCASGISVKRVSLPNEGTSSYDEIERRRKDILRRVKESTFVSGSELSEEEKSEWWALRYSQDKEMQGILQDIETNWLGDAAGLFIPALCDDDEVIASGGNAFNRVLDLSKAFCKEREDMGTADTDCERVFDVDSGNVVLLLDTLAEKIAWESVGVLQKHGIGATRVPSLKFLDMALQTDGTVDADSLFYIINPDGDLNKTERRFKDMLHQQGGWNGCIGSTDSDKARYNGEDIYLYCGHGAGEKHLSPRETFAKTLAPVTLLMGCSSAASNAVADSDAESCGTCVEFVLQGAKGVVGNLWDVGDGDIDRLTGRLLQCWLAIDEIGGRKRTLAEAVAEAKKACWLPFLTGAACVVMGVPKLVRVR